jgi:uncharacterized membrane protein YgdD (TMEM256/DUF423 family)
VTPLLLIGFAGLMGAAGVALLAASAHAAPGAGLDSAAQILLFHASAVIALTAAGRDGLLARPLALLAGLGLAAGATLFAGDIAARAFLGHRLFPMAAPTGGVILIASWLGVTAAAIMAALRSI